MNGNYGGLLVTAVLVAVVAAMFFQSSLPPSKPKVVGMDLGTTYSCVSAFVDGNVVSIPTAANKTVTPSVVSYTVGNGEGQPVPALVGEEARAASHVIFDAKRFIGLSYEEASKSRDLSFYPFEVVERDGRPMFHLSGSPASALISPEEVGAVILRKLHHDAVTFLGGPLAGVVLAIPVEFDESQKNATVQAAKLAGLEVWRVLYEPTAAALAYGVHLAHTAPPSSSSSSPTRVGSVSDSGRLVIVFDMGGGTLDVSLLEVVGGVFEVIATAGDNYLGGEDVNHKLMVYLAGVSSPEELRSLSPQETAALRAAAEWAKRRLNNEDEPTDSVTVPTVTVRGRTRTNIVLTKETFDELMVEIYARSLVPVQEVLSEYSLTPKDITNVVLVGGSTRLFGIRRNLREVFGADKVSAALPPEEAVALGCAMQGGIMVDAWPVLASAVERVDHRARRRRKR